MLSLFLFFAGKMTMSGFSFNPVSILMLFLALTFLFCLLVFYKLTILIDATHVSFKFGLGLFGKSFKLSDIKSCRPVRNSVIYGIGIHMIPNGWLYNVTGLRAIELRFHNRNSVVRIGTGRPEEISRVIQELIGSPVNDSAKREESGGNLVMMVTIIFLAMIIPAIFIIMTNRETRVSTNNQALTIKGMYGMTIPYSEITGVDTVRSLPKIEMRSNGYAFGKTKIGNFRLADTRKVKMFIKTGHEPYIQIESQNRVPVYINFKNRERTVELYSELVGRN